MSNHYVVEWLFGRAATAVLASLRTRYHYRCAYEPMIRTHLHLDTCLLRYGFLDILGILQTLHMDLLKVSSRML